MLPASPRYARKRKREMAAEVYSEPLRPDYPLNGRGRQYPVLCERRRKSRKNYTAEEILRGSPDYEIEDENLEYYRRNTCYNDIFEALALESWLYNHCTNVP